MVKFEVSFVFSCQQTPIGLVRFKSAELPSDVQKEWLAVMRLSTRGRYALRMMTELARQQNGGHVSLGDISDITGISRRYLDQLVISLKRASLLSGRSGKTGGYRLNKSSADITVRQIVEAAIGPINVVECVKHPNSCLKSDGCECRFVYVLINDRITGVLDQIPLSHLVNHDVFKQVAG